MRILPEQQMNGLDEKSEKLRSFIIICAVAALAAFAFGMFGLGDKLAFAVAVVAALCIVYAAVSLKKIYDDAMRESTERMRALERDHKLSVEIYESNPSMLFIIDDRLRMTDCNNACLEFIGVEDKSTLTEEMTNKIEADIPKHSPVDGFTESVAEALREAGRSGFSRLNTLVRVRDGTDRNISVACRRIRTEDSFILACTAVEITELQRVRERLHRKNKMLDLINRIAVLLSPLDSENALELVRRATEIMGRIMEVDRIYIWKNLMIDGHLHYVPEFAWTKPSVPDTFARIPEKGFPYIRGIPDLEARFERGECLNGPLDSMTENERERLSMYDIKSILILPLYLKNEFWGFISFDDLRQERSFAEEEIYFLRSASLMIASSLMREKVCNLPS